MSEALTNGLSRVAGFVPALALFLVVLLIGWLIARVLGKLTATVLRRVGFERAVSRGVLGRALDRTEQDASGIAGRAVYWVLILLTLQVAFAAFGTNPVSTLLTRLVAYLPQVLYAAAILVVVALIARLVRNVIAATLSGLAYGRGLGIAAEVLIVGLGIIAALNQLGVASTVSTAVLITVLATAGATVVVGVGGGLVRPMQSRWESWLDTAARESAAISGAVGDAAQARAQARAEAERRAAQERAERERREAEQREQAERERAERERERAEQQERERAAQEQAERERREAQERSERERAQRERAEREQAEQQWAAQQQAAAQEQAAQEQAARDQAAQEQAARDQAAQEQAAARARDERQNRDSADGGYAPGGAYAASWDEDRGFEVPAYGREAVGGSGWHPFGDEHALAEDDDGPGGYALPGYGPGSQPGYADPSEETALIQPVSADDDEPGSGDDPDRRNPPTR